MASPVDPIARRFPPTRLSLLTRLGSGTDHERADAFTTLVTAYWHPVYTYLRLHHRLESADAEDLTQAFLGEAWAKDIFARYDPARARFRTFLRVCLDRFVSRVQDAERAQKRGGGAPVVSLDVRASEEIIGALGIADPIDQDALFHREFVRALFARAVERLRQELEQRGRATAFALFDRYDLSADDGASYATLAAELGIPVTRVTNQLHAARRRFREIVLDELRELAGSEDEFRADAAEILGLEIR